MATALESNDVLEELRLDFNKIRSRGAVALAEALRSNGTVRSLVIKYNPIGAQGVRALRSVAERIEVDHEGLEANADASWCGWMCCILIRVLMWIFITIGFASYEMLHIAAGGHRLHQHPEETLPT